MFGASNHLTGMNLDPTLYSWGEYAVWTGISSGFSGFTTIGAVGSDCNDWVDDSGKSAFFGLSGDSSTDWASNGGSTTPCNFTVPHLWCIRYQ